MKRFSGLVLGMACLQASAMQLIDVDPMSSEVSGAVAQGEYSRLFVQDDRIVSVKGKSSLYQLQADEMLGDIYIQPLTDKPFVLFLSTEKKHAIQVTLTPTDMPPEGIGLRWGATRHVALPSPVKQPSQQSASNSAKKLASQLLAGKPIEGAVTMPLKKTYFKPIEGGLQAKLVKLVRADDWQGEVYLVKNPARKAAPLSQSTFMTPGTLAVKSTSELLGGREITPLVKVVSRG